jgi:hypothetical protein
MKGYQNFQNVPNKKRRTKPLQNFKRYSDLNRFAKDLSVSQNLTKFAKISIFKSLKYIYIENFDRI